MPAQRIRLMLIDPDKRLRVVHAKAVVTGTSPNWRSLPVVLTDAGGNADKVTTVDLRFNQSGQAEAKSTVSTSFLLPGFTSVSLITLQSMTFSDGSTWTPTKGQICRTSPDLLMRIDTP